MRNYRRAGRDTKNTVGGNTKGVSMSDTRAKFEAAMAARKRQKVEETSRQSGGNGAGFPDIPWAALYQDKQQVFRFKGLPYLVREKGTDSKRIFVAMILGDDDKKFRCIGPDPNERKDWILYRVMNKVLARRWDKDKLTEKGKGGWDYLYATSNPDLYNRCANNNNLGNIYEKGWRFSAVVLINVIDRANYDWHVQNKKFRLLSKKASLFQDRTFFDVGVPDMLYRLIEDDIVACDGNVCWEDYDIVIKKLGESPWYKVYHGIDDAKKLDADVKGLVQDRGLTAEEEAWEMNDIDKLFPITSYKRIKEKLGLFFQRVDKAFGSNYYEELLTLVDKEEMDRAKAQKDSLLAAADEEMSSNSISDEVEPEVQEKPVSIPETKPHPEAETGITPVQTSKETAAITSHPMTDEIWVALANGTSPYCKKDAAGRPIAYVGIPLMSAEEKTLVRGVFDDGSFDWIPEAGELFEGSKSRFLTAEKCLIDPLNGERFSA